MHNNKAIFKKIIRSLGEHLAKHAVSTGNFFVMFNLEDGELPIGKLAKRMSVTSAAGEARFYPARKNDRSPQANSHTNRAWQVVGKFNHESSYQIA